MQSYNYLSNSENLFVLILNLDFDDQLILPIARPNQGLLTNLVLGTVANDLFTTGTHLPN